MTSPRGPFYAWFTAAEVEALASVAELIALGRSREQALQRPLEWAEELIRIEARFADRREARTDDAYQSSTDTLRHLNTLVGASARAPAQVGQAEQNPKFPRIGFDQRERVSLSIFLQAALEDSNRAWREVSGHQGSMTAPDPVGARLRSAARRASGLLRSRLDGQPRLLRLVPDPRVDRQLGKANVGQPDVARYDQQMRTGERTTLRRTPGQ